MEIEESCTLTPKGGKLDKLPHDLLAFIISFVTNDLREVLRLAMLSKKIYKEHFNCTSGVWKPLCIQSWKVTEQHLTQWPKMSSWKSLYATLQHWVPREGFYVLLDAYPWGILFLMRILDGNFVCDVVRYNEEKQKQDCYRLFNVSCVDKSVASLEGSNLKFRVTFESKENRQNRIGRTSISPILANDIFPTVFGRIPAFPVETMTLTCISTAEEHKEDSLDNLTGDDGRENVDDLPNSLWFPWNPNWNESPDIRKMVLELVCKSSSSASKYQGKELRFQWVDGPTRTSELVYTADMPIIRPGLYSGTYGEHYGQFRHEILLIEYRRFPLHNTNERTRVWDDIGKTIFAGRGNSIVKEIQQSIDGMGNATVKEIIFVVGKKVTGDIHVPLGNETFVALVHPLLQFTRAVGETIRNRESKKVLKVKRFFHGWGTLAYPNFHRPSWSAGSLVQVEDDSESGVHQFGFAWERGVECAIILRWLDIQSTHPFLKERTVN